LDDLEKAAILRSKGPISSAEAREALQEAHGDLLDAIIILERRGKIDSPPGGGFYTTERSHDYP
jgi:translation elongation factor EF-Ts